MKSVGQNFHRISRKNQRQSCLSDYSRICADIWPLANGSRPICAAIVFGHADFTDDADFSSWEGFVPQISQIYTDFYLPIVLPLFLFFFFFFLMPNRSFRPLKSFFMIRPKPWVFRLFLVKYRSLVWLYILTARLPLGKMR